MSILRLEAVLIFCMNYLYGFLNDLVPVAIVLNVLINFRTYIT